MEYVVYFEIGGKKMKTTVTANTPEQANIIVRGKIKIHKTVTKFEDMLGPEASKSLKDLNDILNTTGK